MLEFISTVKCIAVLGYRLTGTLGDMTTLGARGRLCLAGVVGWPALAPLGGLLAFMAGGWYVLEFCCEFVFAGGAGSGAPAWLCVGTS